MCMLKIITQEEFESKDFYCKCGNTAYGSGFFPCDAQENEIDLRKQAVGTVCMYAQIAE